MKYLLFLTVGVCCFLSACSPSGKSNSANTHKTYNHLFIVGNTGDITARVQLEKDLAAAVTAKGFTVIKSIDILPPSLKDPKPPAKEQIADSLRSTGCDALFVMSLKKKEELKYDPGVKVNGTNPWLGGVLATTLGYETNNKGEIKGVDQPGSFTYKDGFHIVCELVDAASLNVVYSTTSELIEYSKLHTVGRNYINSLVELMQTKKILRKAKS